MQEELEQKSVAISIKAGKLTANLLKKALEKASTLSGRAQAFPISRSQMVTSSPLSVLPVNTVLISH